jgi:hypothetical protein
MKLLSSSRLRGTVFQCGPLLVLMACSGGAGAGEIDACSLITDQEAQAAVGGATDPPKASRIGEGFSQCQWRIRGGTALDSSVVLQARADTSDADFDRFVEQNAPKIAGELVPIAGLGNKAYQHIATFVLSGDAMVVVTVVNKESMEQAEQRQQDLARAAIGRLP